MTLVPISTGTMVLKLGPWEEVPVRNPNRGLVLDFLAFLPPKNDGKLEEDGEDEEDELDEIEELSEDDHLFFLFLLLFFFLYFLAFFFLFFLSAFTFSSRCLFPAVLHLILTFHTPCAAVGGSSLSSSHSLGCPSHESDHPLGAACPSA